MSAITPDDIKDAVDLDFTSGKEDWVVYSLSDGSVIKIKLILVGVKRLKRTLPDGTPIYTTNTQNIVRLASHKFDKTAIPNNHAERPYS